MKFIRSILFRVLCGFLLLASMLWFLFATTPGLKLVVHVSNRLLPGTLHVERIDGHLWKKLTLENLSYTENNRRIQLGGAHITWHLNSLFPLRITLETLELTQLALLEDTTEWSLDAVKLGGAWQKGGKPALRGLHLEGNTQILLPQGLLKANIFADGQIITSQCVLGDNHITVKGPIKGPWTIHAKLADLKPLHPNLEALHSTLILDAVVHDAKNATLKAHLTPGTYTLPKGSTPEAIQFRYASVDALLTPKTLQLESEIRINEQVSGKLALQLPGVRLNSVPPPNQNITGEANLHVTSFDFLDEFTKLGADGTLIQNLHGKLQATLRVAGTLNKPKLNSEIILNKAHVTLPDLGLILNPIDITAKTDAENWETHALIRSNSGPALILDGKGTLTPELTGDAVIQGENVIFMHTSEYQVQASPNLTLTLKPQAYDINGSILIPKAHIAPVTFNHTVKLTHDVVFTDEKTDPNPLNLTSNIMLDMGHDVNIDIRGIQGFVDGQLHIKQLPKQPVTAVGELKLRNGRYEAYGQKLAIEQGELIFLGQQIDNPNIRVRAVRHFDQANAQFSGSNKLLDFQDTNLDTQNLGNNTTVGITVSGRLDSPRVKLFSQPPNLSQANILSMLLLGKPADQASKSGGAILLQAMSSMHLDSGSKGLKMLQDLQKSAGIELDVQNDSLGTSSGDISKTSVMVGKSITKRLYLRYNVGVFQENSSVLTLTYLLNKFLSVKVTASDIGNGIDFMYSRSD